MLIEEKECFIRRKANEHIPETNDKILWSFHAVKKLRVEGLRRSDVEDLLRESIIIEDYTMEGRPLPCCLVLGFIGSIPVHSVIAIDSDLDRIFIIFEFGDVKEVTDIKFDLKKKKYIGVDAELYKKIRTKAKKLHTDKIL